MPGSWLIGCAEARPAGAKGAGVFATAPIVAGTTVVAFGGSVVDRAGLDALPVERSRHAMQIDDGLYLVAEAPSAPGDYVNHSCDPNCGIRNGVLVVTMRDVAAGEELTFDYAMSDGDDYDEFACACGSPRCRGTVRGTDWRLPELRRRYAGWFSDHLAARHRALSDGADQSSGDSLAHRAHTPTRSSR